MHDFSEGSEEGRDSSWRDDFGEDLERIQGFEGANFTELGLCSKFWRVSIFAGSSKDITFEDWDCLLESIVKVDVVWRFGESNKESVNGEGENVELRTSSKGFPELLDSTGERILLVGDDNVAECRANEISNVLISRSKELSEGHEESGFLNILDVSRDVLNNGVDTFGDRNSDLSVRVVPLFEVREEIGDKAIRRRCELVWFRVEVEVETLENRYECSNARLLSCSSGPREFEVVMSEFRVG